MRGIRSAPKALLAALGIAALLGCAREGEPPRILGAAFGPDRIVLSLAPAAEVDRAAVLSGEGALLLGRSFAGRRARRLRIEVPWEPGRRYRVRVRWRGGRTAERLVRAPARAAAPLALSLEIPHGLESPRTFLPGGARLHATLRVTSGRAGAGGFRVRLRLPPGVRSGPLPEGVAGDARTLSARGELTAVNDVWFRQIPLRLPERAAGPLAFEAELLAEGAGAPPPLRRRAEVRLRSAAELRRLVRVERTALPTDEKGNPDPQILSDTLLLPGGPGDFLLSLLGRGGPPANPFVPFRYQTLWIRNTSEGAVGLTLSARILLLGGAEEARFLRAPDLLSGGTGRSVAFTVIPAGGSERVVLPIYLDPRGAEPGRYLRRIRLGPWGTEAELLTLDLPLELRRPSLRAFLVTALTMLIALAGGSVLAWRGKALLRALPLRLLAGAATFAAATFVLVNIPEFVIGNLALIALGPFSFLLSDLFTQVALYALAVAYLMRYPVPGALALLALVRKLLLALTIHSFQIVPFLLLGAEIVFLEGAAWLAGVTRGPAGGRLFDRWPLERWVPLWAGGMAFVAADVLITGVSFHLHIFFYRLIFADWYIVLYLVVSSALFTFLGVGLGLRLGAPLREVAG